MSKNHRFFFDKFWWSFGEKLNFKGLKNVTGQVTLILTFTLGHVWREHHRAKGKKAPLCMRMQGKSFLTQQQTRDLEHWKNNSERLEYEESRAREGELKLLQKIRQQLLRGSLQSSPCWWTSWALSWYPVGQICVYAWMDVKKGVIECDWSLFKNATISIEFYYHSLMLSCNMIVKLNSTFFG